MGKDGQKHSSKPEGDTLVKTRSEIREPRAFTIVIHNDDYTTQEFVVHVFTGFFQLNQDDAHAMMLKVHMEGKARFGHYSKDIAESKVALITSYCRQSGMPLLLTAEPI